MATKGRFYNGQLEYFESATHERILVAAPIVFREDFLGKALDTNIWGARDTGGGTEAYKAGAANGVLELALDATNEVQLAGVDFADQRPFAIANSLVAEFRFRFTVLPTGSVVACVGLCGNHNAAVNTVGESIWFRVDGSGAVKVETDDTSHETSLVSTGVTLVANEWMIGRIDMTTPTACMFYINGNQVAAATAFNMNQVTTLVLQPVMRIGKESGATTVGTLEVDTVKVWSKRS